MIMQAPFADLEALVNRETVAHLSNAVATLAGVEVRGIFAGPHTRGDVGMLGMADARPTFMLLTADIPASLLRWFDPEFDAETPLPDVSPDPVDWRLVVRGLTYVVTEHEPDGTGMSTLVLKREPRA
jgi:hypothetical protein